MFRYNLVSAKCVCSFIFVHCDIHVCCWTALSEVSFAGSQFLGHGPDDSDVNDCFRKIGFRVYGQKSFCSALQCSQCKEYFLGTPTNGHQCYRQMQVDLEYCLDPNSQTDCLHDPVALLPGRTVFYAVQPKYLNVDIRITIDVTQGGWALGCDWQCMENALVRLVWKWGPKWSGYFNGGSRVRLV